MKTSHTVETLGVPICEYRPKRNNEQLVLFTVNETLLLISINFR